MKLKAEELRELRKLCDEPRGLNLGTNVALAFRLANAVPHLVEMLDDASDAWTEHLSGCADLDTPADLRSFGWSVAVHNDYRLNGEPHTFWLFTKGDRCVKGEGRTDREALNLIRAQVREGKSISHNELLEELKR